MRCKTHARRLLYAQFLLLALIVFVCAQATSASAWTITGHSAVVDIATRYLSPRTKNHIRDLLGRDPEELADLSMWADDIAAERPETDPWHAVDIPHYGSSYDRNRDCRNDDCIVERIKLFAHTLADRRGAKSLRTEALKYLIHLVGDLHVPLHAYAPGPPHDLWKGWDGWEGPWVQIGDRTYQLHIWWDWGFVAGLGADSSEIASILAARITTQELESWARGTPEDWANESFGIARTFVLKHALVAPARVAGNSEDAPIILNVEVLDEGRSIVAERLTAAGVRLAWLLNRVLD